MGKQVLPWIIIAALLLTAANIFAQDAKAKAKALEGTWTVISITEDDHFVDESKMAELGVKMYLVIENNTMTAKQIHQGETVTAPAATFEVVGNALKFDEGEVLYYHLEEDILTLTNISDENTTEDIEPAIIISRRQ
jgi:hypothetical protein